jgi:hypothetical protein
MDMHFGQGRPKLTLRTSHRREVRLGVSHRDVPSAWTAPAKDRDAGIEPPRTGKAKRR